MLFFLVLVAFNNSLTNPVPNEIARLRLGLVIPIGTSITNQKKKCIYQVFYSLIFFL